MSEQNVAPQLGLKKKSEYAGGVYLEVFEKTLCQRSHTELPGWEPAKDTQNPSTKEVVKNWVINYDSLAAFIVDSNWGSTEFSAEKGGGKATSLKLTLLAGDLRAILQLKWTQNGPEPVLKRFFKVAPNIDFEKPLLISVFRTMDNKTAVSFRQGDSPDPDEWTKVEEYWKRPVDPVTGKPVRDAQQTGADGSILPQPIHYDVDDSWDYKPQEKFLLQYYLDKVQPKVKAIAERHGIKPPNSDTDFYTDDNASVPEVTSRPANCVALSLADMATGQQKAELKELSDLIGWDFPSMCQSVLGCNYDELNKEGASFAIYKMKETAKQKGLTLPEKPKPQEFSGPPQTAPTGDWGPAATATAPAPAAAPPDGDWG